MPALLDATTRSSVFGQVIDLRGSNDATVIPEKSAS